MARWWTPFWRTSVARLRNLLKDRVAARHVTCGLGSYGAHSAACLAAAGSGPGRTRIGAVTTGTWSGSSSAPTSRSHSAQPNLGDDLTRQHCGRAQSAADPLAVRPSKPVQCQQGRGSARQGLKWVECTAAP